MKCDRRWYHDGRYERECEEHERRRDAWFGIRTYRNSRGEAVGWRMPGWIWFSDPVGYDANGTQVFQEMAQESV